MSVRAKMRCDAIEGNPDGSGTVRLYPVVGNSPENERFFKYTPGGSLVLSTVNPDAIKQFTVGEEFYVDIRPAVAMPEPDEPELDPAVEPVRELPVPEEGEAPKTTPEPFESTFDMGPESGRTPALVPGPQEPFVAAPLTPLEGTENGQLNETPPETPSGL